MPSNTAQPSNAAHPPSARETSTHEVATAAPTRVEAAERHTPSKPAPAPEERSTVEVEGGPAQLKPDGR